MKVHSIRFHATILYSGILALILILFCSIIFFGARYILYRDLDEELLIKAKEIAAILHAYEQIEDEDESSVAAMLRRRGDDYGVGSSKAVIDKLLHEQTDILNLENDYVAVINNQGFIVLRTKNVNSGLIAILRNEKALSFTKIIFKDFIYQNTFRVVNFPFVYHGLPFSIQVCTSLEDIKNTLHELIFFIGIATLFLLVLTSFMGSVLAAHILKPVTTITNLANSITHKDLSVRIKEDSEDTEVIYLIKSLNDMIARLEESFGYINDFSAHVAHELKTPLAIMRGEIELALEHEQISSEIEDVLSCSLEEIGRMLNIINDLLLLARLEKKQGVFKYEKLELTRFLSEIAEKSRIIATTKNITIAIQMPAHHLFVLADKTHLRRLFLNIITNAIKFTHDNGNIVVSVSSDNGRSRIMIKDTGIGISADNLQRVFDKFFRVNAQTPDTMPGSGLGLSIALSIAKAHQGDITVTSCLNKGTTVTVTLPLMT